MNTQRLNPNRQQGNTLLMTISITALIGFLLATYLTLVSSQNGANARSQSWNSAMPIVEAGIEEALAHLNTPRGLTNGPLDVDNWVLSGGIYTVNRSLGDSRYSVSIHNYRVGDPTSDPFVESRGFVTMPLLLTAAEGPLLAAAGGTPSYLGRGVRARTHRDFIFTKGMVAKDSIDLNGNNIQTDSFDSMDPMYSTNGMYVPGMAKDNGDIAVNSALTNSMDVGNANIYGHISVGPGGAIDIGPQGSVGSKTWHQNGSKGVESGWSKDDMNVSFDEVVIPFSGGLPLPGGGWITNTTYTMSSNSAAGAAVNIYPATCGGTITTNTVTTVNPPLPFPSGPVTTNKNIGGQITGYTYDRYVCTTVTITTNAVSTATYYDYVFTDSGDYSGHTISGTVYIKNSVRVYVTDTLDISAMVIKSGAALKLYSSAPEVTLSGNTTANSDGTADSFSFWGTSAVKKITFSGNASFTGTIYAPEAAFTLNGSGNDVIDFIGASITKSVKMEGHFNFHYDEALRRIGPFRAYIVTGWNEMTPGEISNAAQ
jgi:hypothetical protein